MSSYTNSEIYSFTEYLSNDLLDSHRSGLADRSPSDPALGFFSRSEPNWSVQTNPVFWLMQPIRTMLSLYLHIPPQAQLEVPFSSPVLRSGFSGLHALLTRLDLLGLLVCSYGPSQLPSCRGVGASSVALSSAWPSSDLTFSNGIVRLNWFSPICFHFCPSWLSPTRPRSSDP